MNSTDQSVVQCPHRPGCDGCPHFEDNPAAVYAEKVSASTELTAFYDLYEWPATIGAPQGRTLGYRNRARMLVDERGRLGFYRAGTRDIYPIEVCAVHEPGVEERLDRVRKNPASAAMRYVDVRASATDAIVTFGVEQMPTPEVIEQLKLVADDHTSVHLNVGGKTALLTGRQQVLQGSETLAMTVDGRTYEVPPTAFFQINTEVLEQIHGVIKPWVSDAPVLWDLYCGVGVHGIGCAGEGQRVRGFDIEQTGLEAAARNAKANGVDATFAEATDATLEIEEGEANAIVNPARAGLAWNLPGKLADAGIQRLAYVSCDPLTFYRDAERLENAGFRLAEVHAFDMMPRTAHIELVGLFERGDRSKRWDDLGDGVMGVTAGEGREVWVGLVAGAVAKRATLPGGAVTLERIRKVEDASVVRLVAPRAMEAATLRALLRRWGFPVVGDAKYGRKSANFRWLRDHALDVPALHRITRGDETSQLPSFLLSLFRVPREVMQRLPDSEKGPT